MKNITTGLLLAGLVVGVTSNTMQATGGRFFANERPKHSASRRARRASSASARSPTISTTGRRCRRDGLGDRRRDGRRQDARLHGRRPGHDRLHRHHQPRQSAAARHRRPRPDPGDDTDYSPTSVDVLGNQYALVGANTSESLTNTSGKLVVVDIATHGIVTEIDLGGQPDSIKISPDRKYAAIVIENERNEDLCVGGTPASGDRSGRGRLRGRRRRSRRPAADARSAILPATSSVIKLNGPPLAWGLPDVVSLTGLSAYAPEDPEPEFVDINDRNEAVVTLQENNHVVIVDLPTLDDQRTFWRGRRHAQRRRPHRRRRDLPDRNADRRAPRARCRRLGAGTLWQARTSRRPTKATCSAAAAGSRSSAATAPWRSTAAPRSKSSPSSTATIRKVAPMPRAPSRRRSNTAASGGDDYLFVGTERGSFVAVYKLDHFGRPKFEQLLPGPLGPEGLLAIPHRNLLIASGETDLEGFGVRSTVMIYELKRGKPAYPQILSDD